MLSAPFVAKNLRFSGFRSFAFLAFHFAPPRRLVEQLPKNFPLSRLHLPPLIRRAFVAEPGHLLLSADYSQIELRVLAHLSGDVGLIEAFTSGMDFHQATAARVFGVPNSPA